MIWLAWRQFRAQAVAGALGVALLGSMLLLTGPGLADRYAEGLVLCGTDCHDFKDQFLDQYQPGQLAVTAAVLAVPALIGLFWGAPLVARELDAGTHRLAWNQSVTRTRWLAVKLVLVGLAAMAVTGIVTWAASWWADPLDAAALETPRLPWSMTFSVQGVVPIAHALFAVTLGVAIGILVRRSLPAMAITLAVFVAVQVAVPLLVRPHFVPAVTETVTIAPGNVDGFSSSGPGRMRVAATSPDPGGWLLSSYTVDGSGRRVEDLPISPENSPACGPGELETCTAEIERLGYRQVSTYHPQSHFWPLQWAEAGLYAGLAAALVGFCFAWLRRRVA